MITKKIKCWYCSRQVYYDSIEGELMKHCYHCGSALNFPKRKNQILYCVRGLPGAGKTTLADKLTPGRVIEADQYFMLDTGVYKYDKNYIADAHQWCQLRTAAELQNGLDVSVANTFVKRWTLEPYYKIAKNMNVLLVEITVKPDVTCEELAVRNIHNVPLETIEKMASEWEN